EFCMTTPSNKESFPDTSPERPPRFSSLALASIGGGGAIVFFLLAVIFYGSHDSWWGYVLCEICAAAAGTLSGVLILSVLRPRFFQWREADYSRKHADKDLKSMMVTPLAQGGKPVNPPIPPPPPARVFQHEYAIGQGLITRAD